MNFGDVLLAAAVALSAVNAPIQFGIVWTDRLADDLVNGHGHVLTATGEDTPDPVVLPGETRMIEWWIDKRVDPDECPGAATQSWTGAEGFRLSEPNRPARLPRTNGFERFEIPTFFPPFLPPGPAQLTVTGYYDCPGLKRFNFTLTPVHFTVAEAPPPR